MNNRHTVDTINDDQLSQLYDELDRLRAGEESGWDPLVVPTPGQWIARWNSLSPGQRLDRAQAVIETVETANRCHFEGHRQRLEEDQQAWALLARARQEVARWKLNTLEPQTMRAVSDIGRALDETPPGPATTQPGRWLHVTFTSPDETTANTSALALRDRLRAEFPGVGMRITTNATETGAPEICELPHQTIAEEDECEERRLEGAAPSCSPGAEETEPNNPAAEATYTTRPARVHIRTWNGHHDPDLTAWAAPAATWDGNQLVIRTGDGEARPEPGWSLVRWPDGRIIVASPWAVANCYQPLTGEAPTPRDLIDTALRTTPRADCTDWPPRTAHGQGHRYDMRCALCAGEADTLTDAIHAALQPRPEPGQPKEQP